MAAKKDDPKPGKPAPSGPMPQHKRMASGEAIPQGGGKGVTSK